MDNLSNNEGVEKARAAVEAHLKQGPVEVLSAATQVVAGEGWRLGMVPLLAGAMLQGVDA